MPPDSEKSLKRFLSDQTKVLRNVSEGKNWGEDLRLTARKWDDPYFFRGDCRVDRFRTFGIA